MVIICYNLYNQWIVNHFLLVKKMEFIHFLNLFVMVTIASGKSTCRIQSVHSVVVIFSSNISSYAMWDVWDVAHEFWRLISRMILLDLLGLDPNHFWGSGWILSQTASHHASDGLGHGSYGTPRIGSVEPTIPGEGTGLRWWWLYVENMDLSLSVYMRRPCVFIYRYIIYYIHTHTMFLLHYFFVHLRVHTHTLYICKHVLFVSRLLLNGLSNCAWWW
jgi:hypothetical protein